MFINDVGQNTWEEINDGIAGSNYGWPDSEGPDHRTPRTAGPLFSYGHGSGGTTGCAITGGAFYNPATVPVPAVVRRQLLLRRLLQRLDPPLDPASGTAVPRSPPASPAPVDLQVAADGSLYYLARGTGSVWRVSTYTANQAPHDHHAARRTVTVPVGQPATFSVTAPARRRSLPVAAQRRRHPRRDASTSYTLASASLADNGATFRGGGHATRSAAPPATRPRCTVTANNPPTATITHAGRTARSTRRATPINYAGTGTDPEDGSAARRAPSPGRSTSTTTPTPIPSCPPTSGVDRAARSSIPTTGETAANVWYRIHLTVRDAGGLTHSTFSDVVPRIGHPHAGHQPRRPAAHARRPARDHAGRRRGRRRHPAHAGRRLAADGRRHDVRVRVLVGRRRGDAHDRDARREHDLHRHLHAPARSRPAIGLQGYLLQQPQLHGHAR